ncbi:MAG: DUF1614 domain-containing protein [Methanotrichaceae archaeon]|nr:DUF1614 domain-containing protein [Methanotrichaceae archaeon]
MENRLVYSPLSIFFMLLLAFLLFVVVGFLFLDVASTAFMRLGFSWGFALILLLASLLGSGINIPIFRIHSSTPLVRDSCIQVFGVAYCIPVIDNIYESTLVAINLGGAIIPSLISLYLLYKFPQSIIFAVLAVLFVSLLMYKIARPVKGLGIVTPALLPPLIAAMVTLVITAFFSSPNEYKFIIAYVGGTLGTLIGADLFNLSKVRDLGAPIASIGGAGTFDGIFLVGLLAVLLV